ncbi:MAG: ATP-grasp domain-containing protein, partial [Methylococcales bacterium]|nr:ATP-grasp domain-containing protein [Methylococcales bacterium]
MNEALLIVSQTSRALAESAQRFGIAPMVLDAFSDIDTQNVARDSQRIAWSDDGPVNAEQLLNPSEEIAGLVYGSGFEHASELLEPWFKAGKLCGNSPSVVRIVNNPRSFFEMLDNLEIPHPRLRFNSPQQNRGWLVKRMGASGGGHVRHWRGEECFTGRDYFQKYLSGQGISVLFLADGKRAYIVGFNTQWTQLDSFSWGGAINRVALAPEQRMDLVHYVKSLVTKLGLKG